MGTMKAGMLLGVAVFLLHVGSCQRSLGKGYSPMSFTHHLYNATIPENSAPRTYVQSPVKMGIVISDQFWDIKYKLVAGDDENLFRMEEVTVGDFCFLRIRTRAGQVPSLNREVRDTYTLTVEATESLYDYQARTKVLIRVLDANDLKPLFYPASYYVDIKEDTSVRTSVAKVSATDADLGSNAEFYYSFTERSHPFTVDPFTGIISVAKKLDYSQAYKYDLTVLAEDRAKKISGTRKFGNVARVVVNVDKVPPKPPLIKSINITTPNDDRISVNVMVEDGLKRVESLSIIAGDPLKNFEIVPSNLEGHDFQIISTKRMNWLQNPFGVNLSLQAKDRSSPPLLSQIKDLHIPAKQLDSLRFEKEVYHVALSEFAPPKSHVVRLKTIPSYPNVTYHIKSNPDSLKFHINSKSGIIVTTEGMDFETKSRYEFTVATNHRGTETQIVVHIIDENDNTPSFTQSSYQGTLPENVPIGSSILRVSATDSDTDKNGFVTYAIANTVPVPFVVDPFTGVISTSELLDYELMQRLYLLRIWAYDSGHPFSRVSESSVKLLMNNINDNIPLFERVGCNVTIPHDLGVGGSVGVMSAVDLDELEQVRYRIEGGNEHGLFEIHPVSGTIKLAKKIHPALFASGMPSFSLSITATDGIHSSSPATVTISVAPPGKEPSMNCEETGVFKQLAEQLIKSIKPDTLVQEEDSFSDVHIINRHSPKFNAGLPSSIDIREDFLLNSTIVHFKATDDDTGFNSKLLYAISSGNEDGCFCIDMESGELKLICPLDRETKTFYILNITVYDLGTPQKSVWKFLAVNILDVNDHPPTFDQTRYIVSIPENTEVDKSIFQVRAVDYDLDDNGSIRYSLLSSTETFQIDEITGVVKVTAPLDRETYRRHDLRIEARDQPKQDPQLFSITDLVVVLEDINDNPPKFVPKMYKIKVPEDVPLGMTLMWVETYDFDLGLGGEISYNLKNSENGMFFLDILTGALTLEKELDFEKKQFYNLTVRAVDHGKPRALSSSCYVEVEVLDVNENLNPPVFSEFVYMATVMEDTAVGTSVLTLMAADQDQDHDGVVRFQIHGGTGLGVFTIDEETGLIRTADTLDREVVGHYWLTVSATDMGTVPLTSWTEVYVEVLDVNDNPPEFSQPVYFGSVLENAPENEFVLQVAATDVDSTSEGKQTFQILESQRTYFAIDHKTGAIRTLASLDREQKAEHIIEVTVSDNSSPPLASSASVVIQVLDVNDNNPQFSHKLFQVKLPERRGETRPQEVYRMVARDDDKGPNARVTYSLLDDLGQFVIDPDTGVVSSRGDFVPGNYSILSVKATDHGSTMRSSTARLDIEWLPKPTPTSEPLAFDEPHFTFAVMETDPVTHMVGIISTEISSSLLWFDIVGGEGAEDFDVEKNSGSMMIARPLNAGKRSNYNLTVRVTDGTKAITTQAYIRVLDMNEHRPEFLEKHYEVMVPEDTAPWKEILQIIARDEDINSRLVYTIHGSLQSGSVAHFHLDPKSGILVLAEELDFETLPVHTLIIMVRDQEIPVKRNFVKAVIHVEDCNDHAPAFVSPHYPATILSDAATGTEVLRVKALDKDTGSNADIIYSFHSGNADGIFSIDPETGSILVAEPLDKLSQEHYHLHVKATDQGFPQRSDICPVTIQVKLSENVPPKFSSTEYFTEIPESSHVGTPLITITASSPSAVQYRIKDGDPNGTFHISSVSGVLSVQRALNFEECASYRLLVRASTLARASSDAIVYVYVIDENDNPPAFLQDEFVGQISESAPVNSMVMREDKTPLVVRATDADTGINALLVFQILELEMQSVFSIDPSMGTLSIISTVDYESTPEFHFSVQVMDSGVPSLYAVKPAKVTIRILDFNDCPPKFIMSMYESSILFPAVPGMEVIQVTAVDPDSVVSYSIHEGNNPNVFSIDPSSGVISISNASSLKLSYHILVKASDGLYKDTAVVKINVTNITKTNLGFDQMHYATTVMENTTTIQSLAVMRASGSYLNEPLIYSILNPQSMFSMIPTSGVLETTGVPFDREEQDVYDVAVEVRDLRSPPRIATTHVKVYVGDANDNAPEFLNLPNFVTISDESEIGDVFFQVTAMDNDLGENGSVIYLLEDDFSLFKIDPYLGDVSLQRSFDFESMNKYDLSIVARDEGDPSLMCVGELHIQVRNRSNPIFQSPLYRLKIPENLLPFTTILHVQARNPEGFRVIYNLGEENSSKSFHIDFKTGILSTADRLDYETQSRHVLTVRATDSVAGTFSEATVEIEVEDINDNAPAFSQMPYMASLPEGLPIGTSVLQVFATDRDSGRNQELFYELMGTGKNETDVFEIDPVSGLLVTRQVLDYESIQQYHLKVKVTDYGVPPLTSEAFVIINVTDVNDNPPNFSESQYQANLSEMATCGHIVIKIQASDPDISDHNSLEYKIISGNENRHFAINKSSGLISFANVCSRSLDPFYNLTVAVSDGVFQKTAPVNIDMMNSNKHSPYFEKSIYEAELAENAETGTRVIRLAAIDPDDGPYGSVDYTIINKLADEKFAIDNEGQISTSQPLDRENPTQKVIAIKVMAKDGGGKVAFCTVKIILTDENDNAPQFQSSEYQVSIKSTVNKGSPVIQIMAYDADDGKNADVTYMVDDVEDITEELIEINPFTGVVSVKESLVGMENKIFTFNVEARDGGLPFYNTTVPLQVKVVPPEVELPRFTEPLYTFSASEDLPLGSEVGIVKADADIPVIYSLVEGNTIESNKERIFTVDKDSGTLVIQKSIDHEKTKWYKIDVMAHCNHNGTDVASLVSVNIQVQDVNDNQPVFEANPYRAFLAENMPVGATVIQVTANDPDTATSGKVTYRLEPELYDISELFTIDSESGWITTMKEMDSEVMSLYQFHVVAIDHGGSVKLSSSTLVEVTVTDENDNPPHFTEEVYQGSILENSREGEVIVTISTTDADILEENRQVTCYITDGDPFGQFGMVQDGDEWKVVVKASLDREVKEKYSLKITATDGRFQTSSIVEVHVLDINDNSPLCEQLLYTEVVMENSPPGLFILKVTATDPDVGTNGQFSFSLHGPDADKFHINQDTGDLYTLGSLDRELDLEFDLVAKVTDGGGRSCQADILLMIQDQNDNAPKFPTSHYSITVFDNTTVRTPIAVIYAKDPDAGINGEVVYKLLGSDSSYFSLDEYSGILRLESFLADIPQTTFELQVQATDRGLPRRLNSVATVTVNIVDLDNYQPVFQSSQYSAQIPESAAVGTEVLSVSAFSGDSVPILYDIISGNEHGIFQINPKSGVLSVNSPLDYEQRSEYYLSVEGSRGKSSLSDVTMVIINVTDVNDNPPIFNRGDYSAEVPEDIALDDLVMQVMAEDLDGPLNSLVHYSIVNGDPQKQFIINRQSGEIRVNRRLDREEVPHYSLTIQAADGGDPPLSTAVQVTITVSDINDNAPTFSQISHNLFLQEGEPVGSGILQLTVIDKDTPKNGPPFAYHIVSGNEDGHFHVDQGGLLSTTSQLKKRTREQYLLKIQVIDNGHPPLSSICVVKINITEQSTHPPSAVPLEVYVTTTHGDFSRRVLGKLHATDQDLHDVLSYRLASEVPPGGRFSVDEAEGDVVAEGPLEPGLYLLNVSVSDGRLSTWAGVRVHVWAATQPVLDRGFTLRLAGLTPEEFARDHWRSLQRGLSLGLGLPRQELHVASLQSEPGSLALEVLLVWGQQGLDTPVETFPASRLESVAYDVGDAMGLDVLRIRHGACAGPECRQASCRNTVRLLGDVEGPYATARASFSTPRHAWESICSCNGSAVRFDGRGYLKYLYQGQETQGFRLSLSMRTTQTQAVIVTANSTDWGSLEMMHGVLHFRYGCGGGPHSTLHVPGDPVSDDRWHHVLLEANGTAIKLTLDRIHTAVGVAPRPCRFSGPRGSLLFAATQGSRGAPLLGFGGCLGDLQLNGELLRHTEGPAGAVPGARKLFGRYQCCLDSGGCASTPCQNGGSCKENSLGEAQCSCPPLFDGPHCEWKSCEGQPCECPQQDAGGRCLNVSEDCSMNPVLCGRVLEAPGALGLALEICGALFGLLLLAGVFVCGRKLYIRWQKHNAVATRIPGIAEGRSMELTSVGGPGNNLDHDPFRTLKPRNQPDLASLAEGHMQKPAGPVVCSVAPNLPPPPPSNSDNESILKNHWELDYDVYPADPDYFGRPTVQEFPQFDIGENTYTAVTSGDPRRNSRFGGFPFPLERGDRRAPLPPCYSSQNLDDFLGPDGQPLPGPQCPSEYTAISYYPSQPPRSLDGGSSAGYRRLSVRLSVAQPSYSEGVAPPSRASRTRHGSDMAESDYGSCEEVMF
ncbi:protocadherin Fat 2 [Paramormyrops kingsleyae]|uniref:protocadherin Fat 2 n=1 Tax=Paramormyrops kingsleyae TaxID=1676925 RepID=UPI003B971F65